MKDTHAASPDQTLQAPDSALSDSCIPLTAKADTLPRLLAFQVLLRFEKTRHERLKADRLIQEAIHGCKQPLATSDRGFVYALVMGTLRHWQRLEAWIIHLSGRPLKQIEPTVRVLLRLGLFQLYGLHQVPAYAAIHTTVELAKRQKCSPRTVKFLNAILREAQRRLDAGGFEPPDASADFATALLWQTGWPTAWTNLLLKQNTPEDILAMAQATQTPAPLTIRVNTLRITPEDYRPSLEAAGISADAVNESFFLSASSTTGLSEAFRLSAFTGSIQDLPGYEKGHFYVQDPASMWVAHILDPQPGESILDLCAAPGSKTTHIAALANNQAFITAIEPKKERVAILNSNIARLGVQQTSVIQADGLTWTPERNTSEPVSAPTDDQPCLFDKVLVDAPCSGSGTVRRHPEILLHLRKPALESFIQQQRALLEKGFSLLKPGGVLVYSTCSILRAENQDVIQRFISTCPEAQLEADEQRPITENTDGFYAARIRKAT